MPDGQVLEFSGVTKRFGAVMAVSGLSARVEPGRVTGFLGPNGAGKTTTLRILLGLVRATDGRATIGGARYADLAHPLQAVGAVLEASSFHPGRTAAAHLTVYAQAAGIAKTRVDEVLGLVGLTDAAGRKVGGFSLGMRQRLGLAYALLGDPGVLVLDEPTNGLDPEGIRWIRGFLRELAREGRTVLVSSHLLAEVQQTVDALLIISQGRLVFQGSLDELTDPSEYVTVVDAPDRAALVSALQAADVPFEVLRSGLTVRGVEPAAVGAAAAGVALSALQRRGPALEEVFLDLVNGTRVHPSAVGAMGGDAGVAELAGAAGLAGAAELAGASQPAGAATVTSVIATAEGTDAEPDVPADDGASAEFGALADDSAESAESALVAAQLDAEATGAPGAAIAVGAATGAAWVDDAGDDTEHSDGSHPPAATYAVAATGVIDVVHAEPAEESGPAEDAATTASAAAEPIAADAQDEDPWAPEDADPDVEAIGEIDDELSLPESDDARPWENLEKTDADLEADRFFAAFDASQRDRSAEEDLPAPETKHPEPDAEGEPEASALTDEVKVDVSERRNDEGGER